jgi:predicted acetyltransferase
MNFLENKSILQEKVKKNMYKVLICCYLNNHHSASIP